MTNLQMNTANIQRYTDTASVEPEITATKVSLKGGNTVLHHDANALITHTTQLRVADPKRHTNITTTNQADVVRISLDANDNIVATINGKSYEHLGLSNNNPKHSLKINTREGDDRISIDPRIKIQVSVDAGKGDNTVVHEAAQNKPRARPHTGFGVPRFLQQQIQRLFG